MADYDTPECPYCGSEMEWARSFYSQLMPGERTTFWWECAECGAKSPSGMTPADARKAANTLYVSPYLVGTICEYKFPDNGKEDENHD